MEAVLLKVGGIRCPETGNFVLEVVSPWFMLMRVGRMAQTILLRVLPFPV